MFGHPALRLWSRAIRSGLGAGEDIPARVRGNIRCPSCPRIRLGADSLSRKFGFLAFGWSKSRRTALNLIAARLLFMLPGDPERHIANTV